MEIDQEIIMKRWDRWRKYISEGGKSSWPRDEFELMLSLYEEEIENLKEQLKAYQDMAGQRQFH